MLGNARWVFVMLGKAWWVFAMFGGAATMGAVLSRSQYWRGAQHWPSRGSLMKSNKNVIRVCLADEAIDVAANSDNTQRQQSLSCEGKVKQFFGTSATTCALRACMGRSRGSDAGILTAGVLRG
eukprot:1161962-Pelagomonas_calceolata.AAC.2